VYAKEDKATKSSILITKPTVRNDLDSSILLGKSTLQMKESLHVPALASFSAICANEQSPHGHDDVDSPTNLSMFQSWWKGARSVVIEHGKLA
jgi:hypothetical protein